MPHAQVTAQSSVDRELRAQLLACWTDVTNAGGAVGFVAPVTAADVDPLLAAVADRVNEGRALIACSGWTARWPGSPSCRCL